MHSHIVPNCHYFQFIIPGTLSKAPHTLTLLTLHFLNTNLPQYNYVGNIESLQDLHGNDKERMSDLQENSKLD